MNNNTEQGCPKLYSESQMYDCALQFFQFWWNAKGNNTAQGLQEWLPEHLKTVTPTSQQSASIPEPLPALDDEAIEALAHEAVKKDMGDFYNKAGFDTFKNVAFWVDGYKASLNK